MTGAAVVEARAVIAAIGKAISQDEKKESEVMALKLDGTEEAPAPAATNTTSTGSSTTAENDDGEVDEDESVADEVQYFGEGQEALWVDVASQASNSLLDVFSPFSGLASPAPEEVQQEQQHLHRPVAWARSPSWAPANRLRRKKKKARSHIVLLSATNASISRGKAIPLSQTLSASIMQTPKTVHASLKTASSGSTRRNTILDAEVVVDDISTLGFDNTFEDTKTKADGEDLSIASLNEILDASPVNQIVSPAEQLESIEIEANEKSNITRRKKLRVLNLFHQWKGRRQQQLKLDKTIPEETQNEITDDDDGGEAMQTAIAPKAAKREIERFVATFVDDEDDDKASPIVEGLEKTKDYDQKLQQALQKAMTSDDAGSINSLDGGVPLNGAEAAEANPCLTPAAYEGLDFEQVKQFLAASRGTPEIPVQKSFDSFDDNRHDGSLMAASFLPFRPLAMMSKKTENTTAVTPATATKKKLRLRLLRKEKQKPETQKPAQEVKTKDPPSTREEEAVPVDLHNPVSPASTGISAPEYDGDADIGISDKYFVPGARPTVPDRYTIASAFREFPLEAYNGLWNACYECVGAENGTASVCSDNPTYQRTHMNAFLTDSLFSNGMDDDDGILATEEDRYSTAPGSTLPTPVAETPKEASATFSTDKYALHSVPDEIIQENGVGVEVEHQPSSVKRRRMFALFGRQHKTGDGGLSSDDENSRISRTSSSNLRLRRPFSFQIPKANTNNRPIMLRTASLRRGERLSSSAQRFTFKQPTAIPAHGRPPRNSHGLPPRNDKVKQSSLDVVPTLLVEEKPLGERMHSAIEDPHISELEEEKEEEVAPNTSSLQTAMVVSPTSAFAPAVTGNAAPPPVPPPPAIPQVRQSSAHAALATAATVPNDFSDNAPSMLHESRSAFTEHDSLLARIKYPNHRTQSNMQLLQQRHQQLLDNDSLVARIRQQNLRAQQQTQTPTPTDQGSSGEVQSHSRGIDP